MTSRWMYRLLLCSGLFLLAPATLATTLLDGTQGRIHYELSGTGTGIPVILVHGFSTPMWVWNPLYDALVQDGRQVLRFDLHGRGRSERAPADALDVFHQQIRDLRQALKLDAPADLVGLSMGGAIVSSYTAKHPEDVRRVVFIAPFNTGRTVPLLGWSPVGEWLAKYVLVPISLRWGYRNNFADAEAFLAANPDIARRFRENRNSHDYSMALLSSLRNIIMKDQIHWYQKVGNQRRDILLVWGQSDSVVPYKQSENVQAALQGAELLSVPGAGHFPQLERADVVVPAIVQFLKH